MARYRINEDAHFNDAFMLVSREIEDVEGNKLDQRVGREQFCCVVAKGSVVEVGDNIIPAGYMEPLDDDAREMVKKHPPAEWHANVSALPLGGGQPIVGPGATSFQNETTGPQSSAPVIPAAVAAAEREAMRLPTIKGRRP